MSFPFLNKLKTLRLTSNSTLHQSSVIMVLLTILYFYNFHVNDIWTPNESFYAESVREMFESGNFLDIQYNYEARYNKPPLTYWAIAASATVFGLNEFSIRLPIVLMALGSIWLTYLLGKDLYGQKGGLYAMIIYGLGLQLLAVKQYASPEIPLTFFFTLTLFWFNRAYQQRSNKLLGLSYLALGLTVLTKGFPYIIVIGGIVLFYLVLKNWQQWRTLLKEILWLKLPLGVLIVGLIGLSWVIYMYLKDGDAFWEIYYRETFGRALEKKSKGLQPFFYIGVISWSIIPYSLAFFFGIYYWIKNRASVSRILFPIAWIVVMLVIFTVSKGKIPTYIIQAHPAFALFLVPLFLENNKLKVFTFLNMVMSAILILGTGYLIVALEMHWLFFLIPAIIGLLFATGFPSLDKEHFQLLPFWAMFGFLVVFSSYLPQLEDYRSYDKIGAVVKERQIDTSTPLLLDAWLIHNLPYYAERRAIRDQSTAMINDNAKEKETLALLPLAHLAEIDFSYDILWQGLIYDFASESQFFKFVMATNEAKKGNEEKFATYVLIHKP